MHLDTVNVYILSNGMVTRKFETGDARKFAQRDIPTNGYSFLIHPGEEEVYLKLKSSGSVHTPIKLYPIHEFFYFEEIQNALLWLFYGVIFASLVANLAFYVALKDRLYLYYVFYVVANAIYTSTDFELGFQFLWPNFPYLNKFSLIAHCFSLFIYVFCDYFLELKSKYPRLHWIFNGIIIGHIICSVVSLFSYNRAAQMIVWLFSVSPILLIATCFYVFIRERNKINFLFFLAWSFYLLGIMTYALSSANVLTFSPYLSLSVIVSSTFEMVLLFVIVVFKVNRIKEENIENNQQIIELLSDKEKMLEGENIRLEEKVKLRTLEMLEKNDEISSQNEEIISQNEELLYQQQELMRQRQELEIQRMELDEVNKAYTEVNRRLVEYKVHLEDLVTVRTNDLTNANFELGEKNKQLEQYAFMAAHNLRSPIAALLGLTKFIDKEDDMESIKEVIKRIHLSVKKLDVVVKSMSTILNSRNPSERPLEPIILENVLHEALSMLEKEIDEAHVQISHDFSACPQVMAVPTYLHNLYYNLISNSIKYKSESKTPTIQIHSSLMDGKCQLVFTDNGLGIDLQRYKNDLFQPFKRFHAKAEGSGIGLYLVKTQIESMGGNIMVESKVGVGTTFLVELPV